MAGFHLKVPQQWVFHLILQCVFLSMASSLCFSTYWAWISLSPISPLYMPCAPFRMTFSTPRCFSTYSLPFALQNQWVCVAVYSMSLSLLPLLHLHGCSFSNTMKITNMVSINLMLKLPCGGRWSLLLLHGQCPPQIHKMWCLQVRTLHCGVSKEGLLKGQWGIHRGWQPVAYLEEISSQESSELAGWHPGPYWAAASPGPHELCSGSDHSLLVILWPCHSWVCLQGVQGGE